MSALVEVDVDRIVAGDNDRTKFVESEITALAESIRELGLRQPPTLRMVDGLYEIVCGERRVRAVKRLGWRKMDAIVDQLNDSTASKIMLAENTARVELDPIEEGRAYAKRLAAGESEDDVARVAGVSIDTVRRRLALCDLRPDVAELVSCGTLTVGFADLMRGLDVNRQTLASQAMLSGGLDWYAARRLCDRLLGEQQSDGMFDPDSFLVSELIDEANKAKRATRRELLDIIRELLGDAGDTDLRVRAADVLDAETISA